MSEENKIVKGAVVPYRDNLYLMEFSCFNPNKVPTKRMEFKTKNFSVNIVGGLDTDVVNVWDWDILIVIFGIIAKNNDLGVADKRTVTLEMSDLIAKINRSKGGKTYAGIVESFKRLKNTIVTFDGVGKDNEKLDKYYGSTSYIDDFAISTKGNKKTIEVTISRWLYNIISNNKELLSIGSDYFNLKTGLEKVLYRYCRKVVGNHPFSRISISELNNIIANTTEKGKFKTTIRALIKQEPFEKYSIIEEEKNVLSIYNKKMRSSTTTLSKVINFPQPSLFSVEEIEKEKPVSQEWVRMLEMLKDEVDEKHFESWIKPLVGEFGENVLTIFASTRFIKKYVKDNFNGIIESKARSFNIDKVDYLVKSK